MIAITTLIIFTLISFAFGLGIIVGKTFFQPKSTKSPKRIVKQMRDIANGDILTAEHIHAIADVLDSYTDFERDFVDFSERN